MNRTHCAPGHPGMEPRWTSSAKSGVGTAVQAASRVWFTLSHGILNEVYFPEVDRACIRDMGLITTDGQRFFSEEKRHTTHHVRYLGDGVPGFHVTNECQSGRYRIEKELITDPRLSVLLQRTRFVPLQGELADYHLYVLLAPHLGVGGRGNTAWWDRIWGQDFLLAARGADSLALACSAPYLKSSAGFVGCSDGWQDLHKNKQLTEEYTCAENGNVALTAEIDLVACGGEFVLALAFDPEPIGAAHHARASLLDGFDDARATFIEGWTNWHQKLSYAEERQTRGVNFYKNSVAVLNIHTAKKFPGAVVASLSIPWGFSKGDTDRGGYHLAWVRDLVEVTGGLLAAGVRIESSQVLRYLAVTQKSDGSWPQNMWVNGEPYWQGEQLDETAFPVLLAARAWRENLLTPKMLERLWPMVIRALGSLLCRGPATQQDRWEETGGYSTFTLAVAIAALIEGADLMENYAPEMAAYLRETADTWNASIERWTYATGGPLAAEFGVDGYYVRIAPQLSDGGARMQAIVPLKNLCAGEHRTAAQIVSPDALALVTYGLRAPDDPRILNTIRIIDGLLKVETPYGPCWHRYNHDGYGEHADGSPFDGTGIGRAWPLLTGERAHYELAAGRPEEARRLRDAMEAFASDGGMLPEQIWDSPDIPSHRLFFGRPSGSAMPLVWAHAEYVKLCRSLHDGKVFSIPPATSKRYIVEKRQPAFAAWRFSDKIESVPKGKHLRIEVLAPACVHWSVDGWKTARDCQTTDSKLGIHFIEIRADELPPDGNLIFTFRWDATQSWEGRDFHISL